MEEKSNCTVNGFNTTVKNISVVKKLTFIIFHTHIHTYIFQHLQLNYRFCVKKCYYYYPQVIISPNNNICNRKQSKIS